MFFLIQVAQSSLSDEGSSKRGSVDSLDNDESVVKCSFSKIGSHIRLIMAAYGGNVFPKLNWTCPKVREKGSLFTGSRPTRLHTQDDAWTLNPSSPLKWTSPLVCISKMKSPDLLARSLTWK